MAYMHGPLPLSPDMLAVVDDLVHSLLGAAHAQVAAQVGLHLAPGLQADLRRMQSVCVITGTGGCRHLLS